MDHASHQPPLQPPHELSVSRVLTGLAIGGAVVAAGIVLAPHVLPLVGIGGEQVFENTMWVSHGYVAGASLPITEAGSGLAGVINRGIANYVPLIGEKLAEGGWFNALTSAAIGAGGFLAGRTLERCHKGEGFGWGTVLKIGSLITSALVALPVLLSGLTMGLTYLAMLTENNPLIDKTVGIVNHTLGVSGGRMSSAFLGFSGAAAGVAHLFTCGASALPLGLSVLALKKRGAAQMKGKDIKCRIDLKPGVRAGETTEATIRISDPATGQPVTAEDMAVTHTKKLHLLVVDSSLRDYQHIHPEPTGEPGVFAFRFEPKTGNRYSAWADFTTAADRKNHVIKTDFPLGGRNIAPSIRANEKAEAGGLHFTWNMPDSLRKGEDSFVDVTITDAEGRPVTDLQPVMGAFAHLVGFSADGASMLHCHPLGPEPVSDNEGGGPKLRFHIHPETAGPVQFYLQVQRGGKEIYAPFGQVVKSPQRSGESVAAPACHAAR